MVLSNKECQGHHGPPSNHSNYFVKHWYGEHSLPRSYWINFFAVNILLWAIIRFFAYDPGFEDNPRVAAYSLILMWAVLVSMSIWQMVGVWRSASHYSRHSKGLWGRVAQVLMAIAMLGFANTIFSVAVPQVRAYWLIASGNDPFGKFQLRVLNDSTELEFSGHIGFGAAEKVNEYLASHPAVGLIHLNSEGGRLEAARNLANLIEARGLSTYTARGCFSACIIPYAAGKERLIDRNASLGFHQYFFPGTEQIDFSPEYAEDRRYLLSKGINPEFVDRIFGSPPDEMWFPSHEELFQASFITRYPGYGDVAVSGIAPSEIDRFEKILSETPIYLAIKKANPHGYNQIVAAIRRGIERGQSFSEIRKVSMPIVIQTLHQRLPYTSGEAILGFAELYSDQLKFYEKKDPQKCYKFAFRGDRNPDVADLPQDLAEREFTVLTHVIEEYSRFNEIPSEDDVLHSLETVFRGVEQKHGADATLILEDDHSFEDRPKHCSVTISLFEEMLQLPPRDAVDVLRFLFGQVQTENWDMDP